MSLLQVTAIAVAAAELTAGDTILLFLPELLGTFVGAILALATAIWWDRRKEEDQEAQLLLRATTSLLGEMDLISTVAEEIVAEPASAVVPSADEEEDASGGIPLELTIMYLPSAAFSANAEALTLFDPDLQVALSGFYEAVRFTRLHMDAVATFYERGDSAEETISHLENARVYRRASCEFLLTQIPDLRPRLLDLSNAARAKVGKA